MPESEKPTGERIAKLLARAGVASRREIERMIAEGRVALSGVTLDTPATILPNLKGVTVDGTPVAEPERTRMFLFHKPSGLITAERDMAGRPTIYTALRNALPEGAPRLMPVGRLDLNTEGLLLLTNDGELKRLLELPSTGIPRKYRARAFGDITQAQLDELIEGIEIDGIRYGRIDANLERSAGHNKWIELTLSEGKNREVRRVLEYFGLTVSRLIRTSYGPLELLDLPRGAAIEMRREDLDKFLFGLNTKASGSSRRTDRAPATAAPAGNAKPAPGTRSPRPTAARGDDTRRAPVRNDRRDDRRDDRAERRPSRFADPRPEGYRTQRSPARDDRGADRRSDSRSDPSNPRGYGRDERGGNRSTTGGYGAAREDAPRGYGRPTDRRDDARGAPRGGPRSDARHVPRDYGRDSTRDGGRDAARFNARNDRNTGRLDDQRNDRRDDRRDDQRNDRRDFTRETSRNDAPWSDRFGKDNARRSDTHTGNDRRDSRPSRDNYGKGPSDGRGRPSSPYKSGPKGAGSRSDGPRGGGPRGNAPKGRSPSGSPYNSPYNSGPRGPRGGKS